MNNIFISYNVGSNSSLAGLNQLVNLFDPIFIFLQEVNITNDQLLAQVSSNFSGLCNTDIDQAKPGTAVLWKQGLDVNVVNVVPLRLQLIKSGTHGNFVNIYAPTGVQGAIFRRNLFTQDLLSLTQTLSPRPILVGDWNCLSRKEDVENWQTLTSDALSQKISLNLKQLVKDRKYTDGFFISKRSKGWFYLEEKGEKAK